ncbi:alpha/beta fold hydrolase [Sutcliffiella rhizosphaerae]|uniref:AB hydrolase-1 domain-containing protein n=1 Tax=Sutcliffiella rhizosphaerae TaxID=2880967 RepID=A0ABM8YRH0_9BACI|nr:alpha/beta hydrolase [Sutcliffiella rhizosphaerae]CAG9622499.1 hypothetical protein BACCIP111883_03290 [Sutcliffiella rhizosphaerae]
MDNYDLTDKLQSLSDIPILIAQGSKDILPPHNMKLLLLSHLPHAKLVEITECGHWTLLEKPNEKNNIAEGFFTGL